MEKVNKKNENTKTKQAQNPIVKMIEDKKRIAKALEGGVDISALKGIKIVSPL